MKKLVLYCKSFSRDLDRVVALAESISKHNKDNLPFYVSVPKRDIPLFRSRGIENLIEDESVYDGKTSSWIQQQIVKSSF